MSQTNGFQRVLTEGESLKFFLEQMGEFDKAFCEKMAKGSDFTLRLEVHGNKGELLHARVYSDDIRRPRGAQKRVDEKA